MRYSIIISYLYMKKLRPMIVSLEQWMMEAGFEPRILTTILPPSQLFPKVAAASWVYVPISVWEWSAKNTD